MGLTSAFKGLNLKYWLDDVYKMRSESRYALRIGHVDLAVSIEVAVEMCCCCVP
jgi:hypothetical protein